MQPRAACIPDIIHGVMPMSRRNPFGVLALAISLGVLSGIAQAGNEGQEDLDKATKANINAKTLSDLAEVIRLCEGALAKGLDEENTSIAKSLLASALCQRGNDVSKTIFDSIPPDPRWAEYRRVALEDLEKAVKLEPELHKAYYNIARLNLLPDGDAKRAAQALDLAIRYAKADPVLQAQAFVLRSEIQKDSQKRLADLSEAVRVAPDDVAVLRARGAAYSQLDKLTEALADFDAALRLDPKHVPTMEAKSLLLAKMKKFDEAFAVLEQVRKLDPKSASPLAYRAQVNAMKPDLAAALKDLNEALRLEPNSVKSLLLRAAVHRELKENDLARADVEKALTLRPNLDTAVQFLASLLAGEGKFREAIAQVEELVKADPDDAEAQLQLALLYTGDQKYDKAVQIYSNLIAKDASNWMALYGRADTLLSLGKHAEAVADYEKAFKVQPNDSRLLNNYSWVLSTSPFDKVRNGKRALELAKIGRAHV